jgi:tRNA pseudouridine55 synthase
VIGFINLNKSAGYTSHDCVACVRRILNTKRVGHGGTLDPLATGVLPIAVGSATRLLQFLPTHKAYRATIRLGVVTNTDDLEGEVIQQREVSVSKAQIFEALSAFQGQIQQVPPMYSAVQRNGKRLYELARQGKTVEVEPRTVEIYGIEIIDWQSDGLAQPELTLQISCGPGTYIRAIARDLGEALQVGGTLAQLVRTQSCGFELENSLSLTDLEAQANQGLTLIEPVKALLHLPSLSLAEQPALRWCQGQIIPLENKSLSGWTRVHCSGQSPDPKSDQSLNQSENHAFLGLGQIDETGLVPKVVLASPQANAPLLRQ